MCLCSIETNIYINIIYIDPYYNIYKAKKYTSIKQYSTQYGTILPLVRTLHLNKDIDSIIGQWCINAKNIFSYIQYYFNISINIYKYNFIQYRVYKYTYLFHISIWCK